MTYTSHPSCPYPGCGMGVDLNFTVSAPNIIIQNMAYRIVFDVDYPFIFRISSVRLRLRLRTPAGRRPARRRHRQVPGALERSPARRTVARLFFEA